jgi:putative ubiquitin-RnfH superfamily antitoxin RatB of RatAB toxin-antitoxin module
MQIHKRTSANAVIKAIMKQANGIGESKSKARAESNVRGQSGHSISTKVHSIKSIQNLRTVTTQYIYYLKENHGNKVVNHISKETMKEFLLSKNISGGSLNTYISIMGKVANNLSKVGIHSVERKEVHSIRTELKAAGVNLQKNHVNRAPNPKTVPSIIRNVESSSSFVLSARLQIETGMRIDDATNASKWRLNDNNTIYIMQSKNGLNYTTVKVDDKLAQEVRIAISEGYKIDKTEYSKVLKEAVEKTGQEYQGSHSMRYSFAQERMQELQHKFHYTYNEALAQTSLEMSHSRSEIIKHYL